MLFDAWLHLQLSILPVKSAENIRISPPNFTRCNIRTSIHPHIRILPQAEFHGFAKGGVSPVGSFQPATGIFPCHYDFLPPKRGRYAHSMVHPTLMPLASLTLQKICTLRYRTIRLAGRHNPRAAGVLKAINYANRFRRNN